MLSFMIFIMNYFNLLQPYLSLPSSKSMSEFSLSTRTCKPLDHMSKMELVFPFHNLSLCIKAHRKLPWSGKQKPESLQLPLPHFSGTHQLLAFRLKSTVNLSLSLSHCLCLYWDPHQLAPGLLQVPPADLQTFFLTASVIFWDLAPRGPPKESSKKAFIANKFKS